MPVGVCLPSHIVNAHTVRHSLGMSDDGAGRKPGGMAMRYLNAGAQQRRTEKFFPAGNSSRRVGGRSIMQAIAAFFPALHCSLSNMSRAKSPYTVIPSAKA